MVDAASAGGVTPTPPPHGNGIEAPSKGVVSERRAQYESLASQSSSTDAGGHRIGGLGSPAAKQTAANVQRLATSSSLSSVEERSETSASERGGGGAVMALRNYPQANSAVKSIFRGGAEDEQDTSVKDRKMERQDALDARSALTRPAVPPRSRPPPTLEEVAKAPLPAPLITARQPVKSLSPPGSPRIQGRPALKSLSLPTAQLKPHKVKKSQSQRKKERMLAV